MEKYHRLELHVFILFSSSNIAIDGSWWQSGGAAPQHGHIVPGEQNRQSLPQVPGQWSPPPPPRQVAVPAAAHSILTIASRAAPCQPPKVSTAKGMKQIMPSAAQRSSYFDIIKLRAFLTPS